MMPSPYFLCDHCSLLFSHASFNAIDEQQNDIEDYVRKDTLPSLPNLRKETAAGCSFCTELEKRILERTWPDHVHEITIGPATFIHESLWESDLTPEQEGVCMIEVAISSSDSNKFMLTFDLFAYPDSCASIHLRVRRRPPFTDRRSAQCIELLQRWISRCVNFHWQCDSGDEDFWPTRVIDVGPAEGNIDPKLVITSGEASKYIALSHCWGKPGPSIRTIKTMSSTIDSHLSGIPLISMPRNFQQAISMTRALGVRYLWIDSLCIIQDSKDDWATEGSQMDKIYKCAWITLAATSASSSEDGFLEYLLQDRTFSIPVPHCQHPGQSSFSALESHQIIARCMEQRDGQRFEADVDDSPWNNRGWTLQERHLARRIIHFSKSQVFWECRRGIESECGQRILRLPFSITPAHGPEDSPSEYSFESGSSQDETEQTLRSDDNASESSRSDHASIEVSENSAARTRLYTWWFQVLGDFTRRKLTYASDKLPAISGLAKEVNTTHLAINQCEDYYVAGLWIGALNDCLLWMPENPTDMIDPEISRAPSWSWAHLDGVIIPTPADSPNLDPECNMVECVAHGSVLDTTNKYGSITEAFLKLRASTIEICLQGHAAQDDPGYGGWRYDMLLPGNGELIGVISLDQVNYQYTLRLGKLFAMQVKVQQPYVGPGRELHYSGLILQLINEADVFKRIGVFLLDEKHLDLFSSIEKSNITLI